MTEPTLAEMREAVAWAYHRSIENASWLEQRTLNQLVPDAQERTRALRAVLRLLEQMEDDGR